MLKKYLLLLTFFLCTHSLFAQQLTGVWKGRIGGQKAEVKFIQQGDSIRGNAYYYALSGGHRRYSIRGYRDVYTNTITWWDDQLLEEKGRLLGSAGKVPLASAADFNCPGGGVMMLDGKTAPKEESEKENDLHLDKINHTQFPDEWDFVIDNYLVGASDPYVIDSIAMIASGPKQPKAVQPQPAVVIALPKELIIPAEAPVVAAPLTIEEKFVTRQSKYVMDIPLQGDSIELRFYDNAEIDGDSIALFLNKELIFQHVRLSAKPHVVRIAIADMLPENELVMVAENLGKIPPNTSYMIAISDNQRYEANLQSTEATSALIRLVKPKKE